MSKIYDALRRVEHGRGRPRKKSVKKTTRRVIASKKGQNFLRGIHEDFRRALLSLRNSIDSEMKKKDSRVVLFTSAVKGEGKTTIIASLARVMALSEMEKILLVDCSVQDPQLHKLFGIKNKTGILDFLNGTAEFPAIVNTVDEGALDLVTTGQIESMDLTQPLFNSDRMDLFIKEAAQQYDYVLIDSSAILNAPETPIIASFASGIVMVINTGKTKREVIKRAMLMVEKQEGKFIGTVLNRKRYFIPGFIYRRV